MKTEAWLKSVDCGWRVAAVLLPCVHCGKGCKGRAGDVAACYSCYHNVGQCHSAILCGKPVGYSVQDALKVMEASA